MTKELFQLAEFKKLEIQPSGLEHEFKELVNRTWLTPIMKMRFHRYLTLRAHSESFNEESKFLGTLNDMEATQRVINPEAGQMFIGILNFLERN